MLIVSTLGKKVFDQSFVSNQAPRLLLDVPAELLRRPATSVKYRTDIHGVHVKPLCQLLDVCLRFFFPRIEVSFCHSKDIFADVTSPVKKKKKYFCYWFFGMVLKGKRKKRIISKK